MKYAIIALALVLVDRFAFYRGQKHMADRLRGRAQ